MKDGRYTPLIERTKQLAELVAVVDDKHRKIGG